MIKNILILSSNNTGHGHKSITESLLEQFSHYPDVNVHVIDGFTLAGNFGLRIGKLYGSVTRNAKELWKLVWELSLKKPSLLNDFTEVAIKDITPLTAAVSFFLKSYSFYSSYVTLPSK